MFGDAFEAVCNAAKGKVKFLESNLAGYVASSFMAGLYIAFGSLLMLIMGGYFSAAGSPGTKLVCGLVFSVGLCYVFMAGAELFTGNNLVMGAASISGAVPWGKSIKLWVVCWIGNLIGSVVVAVIFTMTGIGNGEEVGAFLQSTAAAKMAAGPLVLFSKAILCNICVCVAVWCSIKLKSEMGKCFIAVACVMTFVSSGYEHSIANMTFLTVGLLNPGTAAITIGGFFYNLIVVTLGNMVGGIIFVALPYYLISRQPKAAK